jgi:hypothetical protein
VDNVSCRHCYDVWQVAAVNRVKLDGELLHSCSTTQHQGCRGCVVQHRYLVQQAGVHHVDLNFGCPVRKVTSRGGGSALPLRPKLFRRLVAAAVAAAGPDVPVTVKLRMGLSHELMTYIQVSGCCCAGSSGSMLDRSC